MRNGKPLLRWSSQYKRWVHLDSPVINSNDRRAWHWQMVINKANGL